MVSNSISIKLFSAYTRDVGLGRIRISLKNMKKLGISKGDVVEIKGKKKSVATCFPLYSTEKKKQVARVDSLTRFNCGSKENESVTIKKMKTKWGTCNTKDKRIWLNLELAKQPFHCIDYVFVHELVHFKERKHSEKFLQLLEKSYPKWRQSKEELNQGILSYFEWGCQSNTKLKTVIGN
jgi:hypothetical protein